MPGRERFAGPLVVAGVLAGFLSLLLLLYPGHSLRRLLLAQGGQSAAGRVYLAALLREYPEDRQLHEAVNRLTKEGLPQGPSPRAVVTVPLGAAARYRADADQAFATMAAATTRTAKRAAFIRGVQTLQSGNLVREALRAGEEHLGPLAHDREALVVMTRIALAADRPDKAQIFIKRALGIEDSP